MKKLNIPPENDHHGHYSPGVISNGNLYISGQLAIDPKTGTLVDGGIESHAKMALENLNTVLQMAGLYPENVVQCRVYIPSIDDWDIIDRVYREFFGNHKPARIILPVGQLHHNSLIEIEAVAEVV